MSFCDAFFVFLHRDRIYASDEREQDEIFLNISRKQWPDWPGWHSVDAITKEFAADHEKLISELSSNQILLSHAREFYIEKVWKPLARLALFDRTTSKLFDIAVQFGLKTAISLLQQTVTRMEPKFIAQKEGVPDQPLLDCVHKISNVNNGEQRLLECLCDVQKAWCSDLVNSKSVTVAQGDSLMERAGYIPR